MPTPTKHELTSLDKAGPYFVKTLGVLPHLNEESRIAATKYVARNVENKTGFTELVDMLGLDDVVDSLKGGDWR